MGIIDTIKSRRSIRAYQDKPVPGEVIEKIVEAGKWAPSGMNMQPWKFIVVANKEIISRISKAILEKVITDPLVQERMKTKTDVIFYSAPLLVVILKEKESKWAEIDCALAAENMMLCASSEGIGSCMIGRIKQIQAKEFLKIEKGYEVHSSIVFGYPAEQPAAKERKQGVVEWVG